MTVVRAMPNYVRLKIDGGVFFFTVALADRSSDLLVRQVDRLRRFYRLTQERYPFETIAICILPDHLHAVWALPLGDSDYPLRWSVFKAGFSPGARRRRTTFGKQDGQTRERAMAATLLGACHP
jgi:putative transposase